MDLKALIRIGLHVTPEDIAADEMYAMLICEEEQNRFDDEKAKSQQ